MSQLDPEEPGAEATPDSPDREEIEIIEVVGLEELSDFGGPCVPGAEPGAEPGADGAGDPRHESRDLPEIDAPHVDSVPTDEHYASEQLVRLQADFDNYRKRVDRERERQRNLATEDLVRRLLPILDDFERALSEDTRCDGSSTFREGIALIFRQVLESLRKEGLTVIDSLGEPFDPAVHEAVATAAYPGLPENTVVEELRRGYLLHDRLLRPAMVRVSIEPGGTSTETEGS